MTNTTKLFLNKQPLPNIRFWDENKKGNNIIYLPEVINVSQSNLALPKFLDSQIRAYYHHITIPPIITNFLGTKLSSQAHYLNLKKEMPVFNYSRTPKSNENEKTNIFDMSALAIDLNAIGKSRSVKLLFTELNKLITSIIQDYPEDSNTILFIDGSMNIDSDNADMLNTIIYASRLSGNKIKTKLFGIVYKLDNKYYPIASRGKEEGELLIIKANIGKIQQYKNKTSTVEVDKEVTKEAINTIIKSESPHKLKDVKKLLNKHTELYGTIDEKIKTLFDDGIVVDVVKKLNSDINKKYNGNVHLNIPQTGVFDMQKVVGLDEVGNYNKQSSELEENVDELIEDLIHSTLEKDPDVDIKIKSIRTRIVDDNKNRFKEFQIKIQHKDFGKTTNKPYTVSFRVPIPVNGKYIKIGGNNYVLINQLFSKIIQKISPNLVRLYTHFSTASLKLKNTKLEKFDYNELEEVFVQRLKSLKKKKIETTEFNNSQRDNLSIKYSIDDLSGFKYSKMSINI